MISPQHVAMMADYNRWQNRSLYAAAAGLDPSDLALERGAFFGSILKTFNHILWGDQLWMSRFAGWPRPELGGQDALLAFADLASLSQARTKADEDIRSWAATVGADWLAGDLTWYSGLLGREMTRPAWLCVTHLFNHQTHHRGQVHAMLTAAGARPEDTDLVFIPGLDA